MEEFLSLIIESPVNSPQDTISGGEGILEDQLVFVKAQQENLDVSPLPNLNDMALYVLVSYLSLPI